tara:strand:- start:565 stop:1542 length:978 start_codon:yes stop_codon:yes gene_type:complete
MSESVLVTGAAGCIGAQVVANLLRDGQVPVAFDITEDRRRLRLLMDVSLADKVTWVVGDICNIDVLKATILENNVKHIVHLAALQVPFCNADPVRGAEVNVVGQVNIFEAARTFEIKGLTYASSVAALPVLDKQWPSTLYGVFKMTDEAIADVYWQTWKVSSIGIRPHTVYGPGRDQGITAAPTKAMLAAAAGKRFTIPFAGPIMLQHAIEVADAFIRSVQSGADGAHVFDLCGADTTISDVVKEIKSCVPEAQVQIKDEILPFVSGLDDRELRNLVGDWPSISLSDGVSQSINSFKNLLSNKLLSYDDVYLDPLGVGHYDLYDS